MSSRLPPLLEPYLALPPEASLILLTNVLGASSNWLVLRFLYSSLQTPGHDALSDVSSQRESKVLLVSFMRDLAFWRENSKKLGIDLDKLAVKKRFGFVDGLSGLCLPNQNSSSRGRAGERVLSSSNLESVASEIKQAIQVLQDGTGEMVVLVIDSLDLLLATGGENVTAIKMNEMLFGLQELVHSTIVSVSADYPLASAQERTPLEIDHSAFLLSLAHRADFIMGLRLLDSGTARDVSGVLRVTVGQGDENGEEVSSHLTNVEERELLYFVGGDGGVRVFERGQ